MSDRPNKNATKIEQKRGKPKGSPKTGGREKGTPNRSSLYVREQLEKAGFNLVARYLKEIDELPAGAPRLAALQWLFSFVYPQLREIDGPSEGSEPPPPSAPAEGTNPAVPTTREERMRMIHGAVPRTPESPA